MKAFIKRALLLILASLLTAAALEAVTLLSYPRQIDLDRMEEFDLHSVLNEEQTVPFHHCTLEGGMYVPTGGDPGLQIFAGQNVRTVVLRLSDVAEQAFDVQLFYPDLSGDRNAACVVTVQVLPGEDTALLFLPEEDPFGYFWLDLDVETQFADIQVSSQTIDQLAQRISAPISIFRLALFFVGALFLYACAWYFFWFQRLRDWVLDRVDDIRDNPGAAVLGALLVVGAGLAGVCLELFWSLMRHRAMLPPRAMIYAVFAMSAAAVFLLRRSLRFRPERIFLVLVLGAGILLSLWEPVAKTTWDDETHYRKAVEVSYLDHAVLTAADEQFTHLATSDTLAYYTQQQQNALLEQMDFVISGSVGEGRAFNLERAGYLPMAIGIWLGRALHLSFSGTFYLGKLTNLLFYAIVMYLGMRRLRSGKMILAVVGLIPTFLFQAANYSYDCFTVACVAFSICYFLGELQRPDEPLTLTNTLLMLGGFALGMSFKMVYFPLILLLLLMPREKFPHQNRVKWFRLGAAAVMLFVLGSYLVPFLTSDPGSALATGDTRGGVDVNAMDQFFFVLTHPLYYAGVLLRYLFTDYFTPASTLKYTIYFPYMHPDTGSLFPAVIGMLAVVGITDRSRDSALYSNWKTRLWAFLMAAASIAVIATSMYVNFTGVGAATIKGCQPRYLMPLMFPVLALCLNNRLILRLRERIPDAVYNGAVLCISGCILYWNVFWMFMPYQPW